jgi:hypothetical protein
MAATVIATHFYAVVTFLAFAMAIKLKPSTQNKPAHLHLAFMTENRQQVEAFYRAALRELLCSFRHWAGRAQHRSGLPRTRGLTLPSRVGQKSSRFLIGEVHSLIGNGSRDARKHAAKTEEELRWRPALKFLNNDKGFGFITPEWRSGRIRSRLFFAARGLAQRSQLRARPGPQDWEV